jgi:hypothetical protein
MHCVYKEVCLVGIQTKLIVYLSLGFVIVVA